ncbi:MAG TPA: DUF1801 domain-containing protein [Opitutaceae bacterium]|nr:DUF1801 domain-containing protein [Opitutaceae bacterium]
MTKPTQATRKTSRKAVQADQPARFSPAVEAYLTDPVIPYQEEIRLIREIILATNPKILEGIKWNVPSFWRGEWFASFHLRSKEGLLLILHRGAKAKALAGERFVQDPETLIKWITDDRCSIAFAGVSDVRKKSPALWAIIQE